ncbi:MAG TPA: tetratricopeptide repeat protein [Candidatus Udaeobacter sp.]|nr:tetratricopeptide repeat protein [Candidatus Udaeobacter sp.]
MIARRDEAARLAAIVEQAIGCHFGGAKGEAERLYKQVLAADPSHPIAGYNLALLLIDQGRLAAARVKLLALVKVRPADAAAHHTLGKVFLAEGAMTKSLFHFRRALELEPARLDTYLELIDAYRLLVRLDDARQVAAIAAARFPRHAEVPTKLGIAFLTAGMREEAGRLFQAALALNPGFVVALYNLAKLTDEEGDRGAALELYRKACSADPAFEPAAFNLLELELRLGSVDAAIAGFEALLKRNPSDSGTLSTRFMAAQYQLGVTAAKLMDLHKRWDARIGVGMPPEGGMRPAGKRHLPSPDRNRRLRVGLVSPDLRDHPVGYFTIRAAEAFDPASIELVVFAGSEADDAIARRFKRCAHRWHGIAGWSDDRLAGAVSDDRIDVLIDLSGHTKGNRLPAFSRRLAPLQLSWAGYVGTTGLKVMDGLIADRFHVPPGEDASYAERVLRLPDDYICFDPPDNGPAVTPLPAGTAAPLTFASFHLPAKINAEVVRLWARILHAEAGSRLWFIYAGFEVAEAQVRIRDWFADAGIAGDRLHFEGVLPRRALLERYGAVDLALDPFPYSGGLTTCEALWMGVPVVTLPGQSFAGRHSFSHLSNVGLTETIARDPEDYVAIVCRLGADRGRLSHLRSELRERVARSPLCDGPRFARHFEAALRELLAESKLGPA